MKSLRVRLASLVLCATAGSAANFVVKGPFVPGSGTYDVVPGMNFEGAPGSIAAGAYTGAGNLILLQGTGTGTAAIGPAGTFNGFGGGSLQPDAAFNGPGIAIAYNGVYTAQAGITYVLSGFLKLGSTTTSGQVYLDFWDVPGDLVVSADNSYSDWQFVYGTFTSPVNIDLGTRVVLDGIVAAPDRVLVDDVAITPLSRFAAPRAIPEPQSYLLAATGIAVLVWSLVGSRKA